VVNKKQRKAICNLLFCVKITPNQLYPSKAADLAPLRHAHNPSKRWESIETLGEVGVEVGNCTPTNACCRDPFFVIAPNAIVLPSLCPHKILVYYTANNNRRFSTLLFSASRRDIEWPTPHPHTIRPYRSKRHKFGKFSKIH